MFNGLIFSISQFSHLSRSLGAHRIAHYLREQGWDIEVVDWANWWTLEQLQEFARSRINQNTKFVAFSHLFSMWSDQMETFSAWIKSTYPEIKIISGSAVNPMFDSPAIDYYIQGYGEHAIVALLKYIVGNGPMPKFNLAASGGKKVISAIHSYPAFPMRSLMVRYEDRDYIDSEEWLAIEFSRGCMFKCSFCNFPVLGVKGDYTRDAEDFELQMKDTHDRFGVSSYIVADETFNDRSEKIQKFADVVEKLNFVPWFSGYIRTDLLISKPQDREHLLRMNFLGHFYGIESFNTASARAVGKGMKSEKIQAGLLEVKKYFETHNRKLYRANIGLIAGLPHETMTSLQQTFEWLQQHWQNQAFSLIPLDIPEDIFDNRPSDITLNYKKYGYRKISDQDLARLEIKYASALKEPNEYKRIALVKELMPWENEHMNVFDATKMVHDIMKTKIETNVFSPGPFQLSYKLKNVKNVEAVLDLDYKSFAALFDGDRSVYINKKLNT